MARRLCYGNIAWYHGPEDAFSEFRSDFGFDLGGECRRWINHRKENAAYLKEWISRLRLVDCSKKLDETFEWVVLALNGDNDRGRRCQGVLGQRAKGRGAINNDDAEAVAWNGPKVVSQGEQGWCPMCGPDFKVTPCRDRRNAMPGALDDCFKESYRSEHGAFRHGSKADTACRVGLWVYVHQEDLAAGQCEGMGEAGGGGGLAYAAFLVGNAEGRWHRLYPGPSAILGCPGQGATENWL